MNSNLVLQLLIQNRYQTEHNHPLTLQKLVTCSVSSGCGRSFLSSFVCLLLDSCLHFLNSFFFQSLISLHTVPFHVYSYFQCPNILFFSLSFFFDIYQDFLYRSLFSSSWLIHPMSRIFSTESWLSHFSFFFFVKLFSFHWQLWWRLLKKIM